MDIKFILYWVKCPKIGLKCHEDGFLDERRCFLMGFLSLKMMEINIFMSKNSYF